MYGWIPCTHNQPWLRGPGLRSRQAEQMIQTRYSDRLAASCCVLFRRAVTLPLSPSLRLRPSVLIGRPRAPRFYRCPAGVEPLQEHVRRGSHQVLRGRNRPRKRGLETAPASQRHGRHAGLRWHQREHGWRYILYCPHVSTHMYRLCKILWEQNRPESM